MLLLGRLEYRSYMYLTLNLKLIRIYESLIIYLFILLAVANVYDVCYLLTSVNLLNLLFIASAQTTLRYMNFGYRSVSKNKCIKAVLIVLNI